MLRAYSQEPIFMSKENWTKLVGLFTIIGAISAFLVVPEFRRFLGLDSPASPEPIKPVSAANSEPKNSPPPSSSASNLSAPAKKRSVDIKINMGEYTDAKWDEYGPGYDGVDPKQPYHIWMRANGFITY